MRSNVYALAALFMMLFAGITLADASGDSSETDTNRNLFSRDELTAFAKKVVKVQSDYEKMYQNNSITSDNILTEFQKDDIAVLYRLIDDLALDHVSVYIDDKRNHWDNFFVMRCYARPSDPDRPYFLAMGLDGSMFFLNGFDTVQFTELVQAKIAPISTPDDALNIAQLYISTVLYQTIKDTDIIMPDTKDVNSAWQPVVNVTLKQFDVYITAVENQAVLRPDMMKRIPVRHHFTIGFDGSLTHEIVE